MELKINSFLQLDCISGDKPGVTASLQFFYVNFTGSGEVRPGLSLEREALALPEDLATWCLLRILHFWSAQC